MMVPNKNNNEKPLKYQGYAIVMQEIPDEISLAFNISGCPHKCEGCHSPNLWDYEGNYLGQDFQKVLSKYKDYISCVCFMGGDQNLNELYELCEQVKNMGLKTCIYSGLDSLQPFTDLICDLMLDYIKIGKYIKKRGGLDNPNTNQKMYKIIQSSTINEPVKTTTVKMLDITDLFQQKKF